MVLSAQNLMSRLPSAFLPDKATGVQAVVGFKLTGAEAGEWMMTIKDGSCTVHEGIASNPSLTITADSDEIGKIFSGQMDGIQAFIQGRLRMAGDISLAMKMLGMFRLK
jgi:putative sterol carrier protein